LRIALHCFDPRGYVQGASVCVLQQIVDLYWSPEATGAQVQSFADAMEEVKRKIAADRKLMAIKVFRNATGSGLRDSVDAVEQILESRNSPSKSAFGNNQP
jgi:ribosomal protein L7/L12